MINQCKNMRLVSRGKICRYAKLTVFGLVRFRASVNQLPAIINQVELFPKSACTKAIKSIE